MSGLTMPRRAAAPAFPAVAGAGAIAHEGFAPMTDSEQFAQLLEARNACVSIVTFGEQYALSVVRDVAMERGMNLRLWSVTRGLRDGLVADAPSAPDSEHPAAALYLLSNDPKLA